MSKFVFRYYNKSESKYCSDIATITRKCTVIAENAPAAVDVFEASVGNLRTKYILVDIQEYDGDKPVGEPIVLKETYVNKQLI